jgi:site-specific DNA-methyltransferase (adenine-specific)
MEIMKLPINKILIGDCIDILSGFPENSIDLIFADPPYNLQLQNELFRPNMSKVLAVDDDWDKFSTISEYDEFTLKWLSACKRVLKPSGSIWVIGSYHNIFRVGYIIQNLGFWILNDIVWIKTNPMPNFRGVRFTNAHETLIWAQKMKGAKYTFNYRTMKSLNDDLQRRSDWYFPICSGQERIRLNGEKAHSTQKPEALIYRIISACTKPRDIVLDPFFGSGTTGAVAKKLHRKWIGIEKESKYASIAENRLKQINHPDLPIMLFMPNEPKDAKKVPFGMLIELGLIDVGQVLRMTGSDATAIITSNGDIKYNDSIGSIHIIASNIVGHKVNGWEYWILRKGRELIPIKDIRMQARKILSNGSKGRK